MNFGHGNGIDEGESGDELGEVSVPVGESNVEMVLVGDESVDSEASDEMLWRCGRGREGFAVETATGEVRPKGCVATPSSLLPALKAEDIPPNTDMNDGNEAGKGGELVWTGMLDRDSARNLRFNGTTFSGTLLSSNACASIDV